MPRTREPQIEILTCRRSGGSAGDKHESAQLLPHFQCRSHCRLLRGVVGDRSWSGTNRARQVRTVSWEQKWTADGAVTLVTLDASMARNLHRELLWTTLFPRETLWWGTVPLSCNDVPVFKHGLEKSVFTVNYRGLGFSCYLLKARCCYKRKTLLWGTLFQTQLMISFLPICIRREIVFQ